MIKQGSFVLLVLLLSCSVTQATVLGMAGAETGDASELPSTFGSTFSAQSATVKSGAYAYSVSTVGGDAGYTYTAATTSTRRFYVYFHSLNANVTASFFDVAIGGTGDVMQARYNTSSPFSVTSPGVGLFSNPNGTGSLTQIGSYTAVNAEQWLRIEMKLIVGTSMEMLVNGTSVASGAVGGANGPTQDFFHWFGQSGSPTGTLYYDNLLTTNTSSYPGDGYDIARQFSGAGTYTSWNPNVGSCPTNWNQTPFNGNSSCANATSGAALCSTTPTACETGITHFDLTSGTGSTGHGSQTVTGSQTINGIKIGAFGNSASDTAVDQVVFVNSAAAETDVALPTFFGGVTNYKQAYFATAPTATQLIGAQAGMNHGASTATHNVSAVWLIADVVTPTAVTQAGGVIIP